MPGAPRGRGVGYASMTDPGQPLNQGIGGGPANKSVLAYPVQAGTGTLAVTTNVDDPQEIVGPFEAPGGAVALVFVLKFLSSTSMPPEGLMAAADDVTAQAEIGHEQIPTLGPNFVRQWTITLPLNSTRVQVRLGIFNPEENAGTNAIFTWAATWI